MSKKISPRSLHIGVLEDDWTTAVPPGYRELTEKIARLARHHVKLEIWIYVAAQSFWKIPLQHGFLCIFDLLVDQWTIRTFT